MPTDEGRSWTPGDIIRTDAFSGGYRVWRVMGVHYGGLHQESAIELQTLDRKPHGTLRVPIELIDCRGSVEVLR